MTQGAADAPVGATHQVQAEAPDETFDAPVARPLTEDVPRIYPRRLPDPTYRELMRRSRTIAKVVAIHFTPTAARQVLHIRQGVLPAAQLARPLRKSFQDLGGTFMKFGQIIGWLEGFKASTDLYSVMAGEFIGGNPTLGVQADRVHADPYGEGWLYHARGMPDPDALDVQGYIQVLDRAIDKIQGDDGSHE